MNYIKIALYLGAWYFCSMMTLFMNKYYMQPKGLNGSGGSLAMAQMLTSLVTGAFKVKRV
jgi:hypothetical protein